MANSQRFQTLQVELGADNVRAILKASNAAEHTEQICYHSHPSLPKCFRRWAQCVSGLGSCYITVI